MAVVCVSDFGVRVGEARLSRAVQAGNIAQIQGDEHRSGRVHGDAPPLAV